MATVMKKYLRLILIILLVIVIFFIIQIAPLIPYFIENPHVIVDILRALFIDGGFAIAFD